MSEVLVLLAHPAWHRSRVHRALAHATTALPGTAGVELRDLGARYPDYVIDVGAEQAALAQARVIVWQHPMHWYGMPALMKLWVDEVLAHGWAYGRGGTALHDKALWLVTSTGAPEAAYSAQGYNGLPFDAFLPPYRQTAALCGLRFLDPLVIHGVANLSDADLTRHGADYARRLADLARTPPEPAPCTNGPGQDVPASDRPSA